MTSPRWEPQVIEGGTDPQFAGWKPAPTAVTGGGDGGGGTVDASKEYTDSRFREAITKIDASHQVIAAKIDTLGSTIDARISGLEGKVTGLTASVPTRQWTMLALLALLAAIVAVLAFGGDRFSGGLEVSGSVAERIGRVEGSIEAMGDKIDRALAQPTSPETDKPSP